MRIISKKRIHEAKIQYPECASSIDGWYRIVSKNSFRNFADLKKTFNSVDKVGMLHIFNIGGNKIRLIVSIHFNRQRLYIRHILNHYEYDKGLWKK